MTWAHTRLNPLYQICLTSDTHHLVYFFLSGEQQHLQIGGTAAGAPIAILFLLL